MQGKIVLEEHFAIPETLEDSRVFGDHVWPDLGPRLIDIQETRLRLMDEAGIEIMLVSLNAPAIQAIHDVKRAIEVARRANDVLAEECRKRPARFVGLAALPMQDPEAATRELTRCIKDLGFKGGLVNGFSQIEKPDTTVYYDLPQYRPFWAEVDRLGLPFYLHPRNPLPGAIPGYDGHPWLLGPNWAFNAETAVHALRLIGSGLFDTHPKLKIILGHLGECLPFNLWRIDNRNGWMKAPHRYAAKKWVGDYFRENFYLTTSGHFRTPALVDAMAELGADRIMFSADYPFEDMGEAAEWFDKAEISEADRLKIGRTNALKLFGIASA